MTDSCGLLLTGARVLDPSQGLYGALYAGVTTWGIRADALPGHRRDDEGSPGWANLPGFIDHVASSSRTQVLTFVHVSGIGLIGATFGWDRERRRAE